MSRHLTFTPACAVVLSALVPGVAGYLSARLEAIETADRNLRALEARLHVRESRDARPASFPTPCLRTPSTPRLRQVPATALGTRDHGKSWLRDVPAWPADPLRESRESGER